MSVCTRSHPCLKQKLRMIDAYTSQAEINGLRGELKQNFTKL